MQAIKQIKSFKAIPNLATQRLKQFFPLQCRIEGWRDIESIGKRFIGDIDLLVDPQELITVVEILLDHGCHCDKEICEQVFSGSFHKHELTLMTKTGSAKIDLHVRPTGSSGEKAFVSTEEAREQAEVIEMDNARFLLPSPLFRLMHNFYHAQYLDRSYLEGVINLRQLVDWVLLWRRFSSEVSIQAMEGKLWEHRQVRPLRVYALNAERYLGMPIPAGIKIGWIEKLFFKRQCLNLQYRWFHASNSLLTYVLSGVRQLIMPEHLRLKYGDLPLLKLVGLRFVGLLDFRWYWRRFADIKKALGV